MGKGHSPHCSPFVPPPPSLVACPSASKLKPPAAHLLGMLCVMVIVTPVVLQEFITETRPTGREQERSAERTSEASSVISCRYGWPHSCHVVNMGSLNSHPALAKSFAAASSCCLPLG